MCNFSDLDMIEQLLEAGADPFIETKIKKDNEPFTAFDLAQFSGFSEALKLLFLYSFSDTRSKGLSLNLKISAPKA